MGLGKMAGQQCNLARGCNTWGRVEGMALVQSAEKSLGDLIGLKNLQIAN